MFQFKLFSVDQTGCAMKINTDGVLLGALAEANSPKTILDIGTGTGVIALMLAQRFKYAKIDAVEIDPLAAKTAENNIKNSMFYNKIEVYPIDFDSFLAENASKRYDFIVSNPPFHLNSLTSPKAKKTLAKHTDGDFFESLIGKVAKHLTEDGLCWLILPQQAAELVKGLANQHQLYPQKQIDILSFEDSEPHRQIVAFGRYQKELVKSRFIIYTKPKIYSAMYENALQNFFTIF